MKKDTFYKIEITYLATDIVETIEIETKDVEWSMGQYQRNRNAFSWKIIE